MTQAPIAKVNEERFASAYFLTTDKAIITKLHRKIKQVKVYTKFYISETKGAWSMSRDPLYIFWPLHISGMGKARNFKISVRIDL